MMLGIENYKEGSPLYVDFQVRPTNTDHLGYAFNVLDWPDGDRTGQVQRDETSARKTFFDVCLQNGRSDCTMSPDANGDIKLVPMLEIEGSMNKYLPPAADLEKYGIFTKPTGNGGTYAYVPLQLVTDDRTGARVAFSGKMVYQPQFKPGTIHKVRLTWVVQMLVDVCQASTGAHCDSYVRNGVDTHNQVQVVQTYYDDFTLTSLNVRENRGTDYAIVYEDPAVDPTPNVDGALVPLALGLESAFLSGRDCDTASTSGACIGNGKPDLTVNGRGEGAPKLAERFDRTKNSAATDEQRWGIPNILRVNTRTYAHRDVALTSIGSVEAKGILDTNFTARWQASAPITPTLLFTYEDTYRAMNDSPESAASAGMRWSGRQLTVNLNGTVEQTTAGMNWSPYAFNGSTWTPVGIEPYLSELDSRYARSAEPGDSTLVTDGKTAAMKIQYMALYNGQNALLRAGAVPIVDPTQFRTDGLERLQLQTGVAIGGGELKSLVIKQLDLAFRVQSKSVYEYLGVLSHKKVGDFTTTIPEKLVKYKISRADGGSNKRFAKVVLGTVLISAGSVYSMTGGASPQWLEIGTQSVMSAAFLTLAALSIYDVYSVTKAITGAGELGRSAAVKTVLSGNSELLGETKLTRAAGLFFAVGLPWGLALYDILHNKLEPGSIAFNTVISGSIAATVVAILLFALNSTVVGVLINAALSFVDGFLQLLCVSGVGGACFGVVGTVTKAISEVLYSGDSTIDLAHKNASGRSDLMNINNLRYKLADPSLGLRQGNPLTYEAQISTQIFHKIPSGTVRNYYRDSFFSANDLRSSSFRYSLTTNKDAAVPNAVRGDMSNAWTLNRNSASTSNESYNYFNGSNTQTVRTEPIVFEAGINRRAPLYLKMAYGVLGYDCWLGVCRSTTVGSSSTNDLGDIIAFDIFPSTLDRFYAMDWGGKNIFTVCLPGSCTAISTGMQFSAPLDYDGDGLLRGNDPNDRTPDTDGDGVTDGHELKLGTRQTVADSDGDGLSDGEEQARGTDPLTSDSDGDGLTDSAELNGTLFTYNTGKQTRLYSDPRKEDSDGDGISDSTEMAFGYNPRAVDPNPIKFSLQVSDADGIVKPGSSFQYTSRLTYIRPQFVLKSQQSSLYMAGPWTTRLGTMLGIVNGGTDKTWETVILPSATYDTPIYTQTRQLQVSGAATSGTQAIANDHTAYVSEYNPNSGWSTLGTITNNQSLNLTVDNDLPTASIGSGTPRFVQGGQAIVIGGTATDPTSHLTGVEVSIDNGPFRPAMLETPVSVEGSTQGWSFTLQAPETEGTTLEVRVRGTDAVGWLGTASAPFTITVDNTPPAVSGIPSGVLRASGEQDQLFVPMTGTVSDGASGVEQVDVLLDIPGSSWQAAEIVISDNSWKILYALPEFGVDNEAIADPTGRHSFIVRASDRVGNVATSAPVALDIDQSAPVATLTSPTDIGNRSTISQPITIGGALREVGDAQSGIASANIAWTTRDLVDALANATLVLGLDDPVGTTSFRDTSGSSHNAICEACPTANAPGYVGQAVAFDKSQSQALVIAPMPVPVTNVTLSGWFKTTCADCGLSSVEALDGATPRVDRQVFLSGGNLCASVWKSGAETICSGSTNYADGEWHHIADVLNGGAHLLYVDGVQVASGLKGSSSSGAQGTLRFGYAPAAATDYFDGSLDQIQMFQQALSADQIRGLYLSWTPVNLVQTGSGVNATTWSATVPRDIEGNYQIDLAGIDVLGNRNNQRSTWGVWRGEIDTRAPRVGISSRTYWNWGTPYTEINAWAEDYNLATDGIVFPCSLSNSAGINNTITSQYAGRGGQAIVTRTYNTLTDPDDTRQRLNRIDVTCAVSEDYTKVAGNGGPRCFPIICTGWHFYQGM